MRRLHLLGFLLSWATTTLLTGGIFDWHQLPGRWTSSFTTRFSC